VISDPQTPPESGLLPPQEPLEAIDNRPGVALAECAHCGREFRPDARNRKRQIYCPGGRCTNAAWMKAHPRIKPVISRPPLGPGKPKLVAAMVRGLLAASNAAG